MRYTQLIGSALHLEMMEFLEEQVFLDQLTSLATTVCSRCEQEPSGSLVLSITCRMCRQYEDWCTQQEEAQHSRQHNKLIATQMCMCNPQALPSAL